MDILNSIWSAISTPNEGLVNICFAFLIIFVEAPLSFSLINNVFEAILKWLFFITYNI